MVEDLFDKKINRRLEESEVIDVLIHKDQPNDPLRAFYSIIYDPLKFDDLYGDRYTGFYVAKMITREELGLSSGTKPGDFDVLIIPFSDNRIYFDRTVASEIKLVRPTRKNPSKNANSLGITQLKGLIADGFPLVSLVHITMPEPLEDHEKMRIKMCNRPIDMDNPKNNIGALEDTRDVYYDWFGDYSSDKQIQRMLVMDIPKYAGIYAACLNVYDNGTTSISSCTQDFWHYQAGYFNPHVKPETVNLIKSHFENHKEKYYCKYVPKYKGDLLGTSGQ